MPTLVWIAFWSSLVGTAMCLQEAAMPLQTKAVKAKNPGKNRDLQRS